MHIDGRSVFGVNADDYDRIRPDYPADWIARHLGPIATGQTALDIGCGTGKLGRTLSSLGFDTLGVEPDARMAAVATTGGLPVEVTPFERWDPGARRFDVVACGQAWHWLDPASRARRTARCMVRGGRLLLVWHMGTHPVDVSDALAEVYRNFAARESAIDDEVREPTDRPTEGDTDPREGVDGPPEDSPIDLGLFTSELRDEGFHGIRQEAVPWSRRYSAQEWRQLLSTESGHLSLPPEQRDRLLDAVQQCVAGMPDGGLRVDYDCILLTAIAIGYPGEATEAERLRTYSTTSVATAE
ncbi:class I SAM-dependent methyltransferase [Streptomyces beijiangensis]|uniref:Methyltransferase domain-containing protein n=1 Tax=Streptomyces beijiangensis TaxID=163361 RepID=A0A939FFR8_9ACTN|nr:class I SAM-dependent methyltransferase [Streptomyces beijiangensis]MBO0516270.1 methyltransferase domain-containing protein [Streptomyces beijiangensis]